MRFSPGGPRFDSQCSQKFTQCYQNVSTEKSVQKLNNVDRTHPVRQIMRCKSICILKLSNTWLGHCLGTPDAASHGSRYLCCSQASGQNKSWPFIGGCSVQFSISGRPSPRSATNTSGCEKRGRTEIALLLYTAIGTHGKRERNREINDLRKKSSI